MLLDEKRGYQIGPTRERDTSTAHSLFVIDLKIYQESHEEVKGANEVIIMARSGPGGLLHLEKVLRSKKMVKREVFDDLRE